MFQTNIFSAELDSGVISEIMTMFSLCITVEKDIFTYVSL